ncbi:uncharacterized protein IL334_003055 [Kwoniella shivajii]|uniref:Uncharacterized protein n=1 Tax=Kwoniella shivajii TaxID=564305 RepID=A0ABZ1D0L1_9TREE|nr:hypothetical protein IL334_003055 [Kwoniella shivajii]
MSRVDPTIVSIFGAKSDVFARAMVRRALDEWCSNTEQEEVKAQVKRRPYEEKYSDTPYDFPKTNFRDVPPISFAPVLTAQNFYLRDVTKPDDLSYGNQSSTSTCFTPLEESSNVQPTEAQHSLAGASSAHEATQRGFSGFNLPSIAELQLPERNSSC